MRYEKPRIEKKDESDYVFDEFNKVGFDIKKLPEIHERIVELTIMPDSHFKDGVKMAKIIEILWDDFNAEDNIQIKQEELKLACLFHDVGKSGPPGASKRERFLIEHIFNPIYFNPKNPKFEGVKTKDLKIDQALDIENIPYKDEIIDYLKKLELHIYDEDTNTLKKEKLNLKNHRMIDLWREHDYWTYELLNKYGGDKISKELKIISSTHHTLEGHDPAMIDGEVPNEAVALELLDKYLILTLIDKYQAFVERSGKTHQETIEILEKMVNSSKKKGIMAHLFSKNEEKVYEQFIKYLDIIKKHPEMASIALEKE